MPLRFFIIALTAGLLACALSPMAAVVRKPPPTLDMLTADLASGDNARMAAARQILPRHGAAAAGKMLPLLEDERDIVRFAALRVLEDCIHEARGTPGEPAVVQLLFSMLAPPASPRLKQTALRLLPLAVREEDALDAVGALLQDPDLREKARACLLECGTQNALDALCGAMAGADIAFRPALLQAVFLFSADKDHACVYPLLEDSSPVVQAAALRALAKLGDPALLLHARRIAAAADTSNVFDAWDGFLRLADALAKRGGHWELAMDVYKEILAATPHPLIRSGAIVGLGTWGDDSVIPVIQDALRADGGRDLEPAALGAFRDLTGRAAHEAMLEVFNTAEPTLRTGMIALFGEKGDPIFLQAIETQITEGDTQTRLEAVKALDRGRIPGAVPMLQRLLEMPASEATGDREIRAAAEKALLSLALGLQQDGDAEGAGRAYLTLYRHAEEEALRQLGLEGVRRFPTPEAYDVVLAMLAAGDIQSLPADAMVGVAMNAIAAGREEEGRRILTDLMPNLKTPDAVRSAAHAMRRHGAGPEMAQALGVIRRWHVLGPFPWRSQDEFKTAYIGEPEVNLEGQYASDGRSLSWEKAESADPLGLLDLSGKLGMIENSVAFAYAEIETATGGPATLRLGSDDGIRVWVNGEVAHELLVDRGLEIDQDVVSVDLRAGRNVILAQITQILGGWSFSMRITHPDGGPLSFQQTSP